MATTTGNCNGTVDPLIQSVLDLPFVADGGRGSRVETGLLRTVIEALYV